VATAQRAAATAQASASSSAATMQAYRLSKILMGVMGVGFIVLVTLAFRSTRTRGAAATATAVGGAPAAVPAPLPMPATDTVSAPALRASVSDAGRDSSVADSVATVPDSIAPDVGAPVPPPAAVRERVVVTAAPARSTDDIVLNAGRVFEGRVLSIRQQSIVVKDEETGLDFEIAKADVDRIVTREGRVIRFGDDNVPLIGDDDDLTPVSHNGRYRVRYAERWGTERGACGTVARDWAPGAGLIIRHMRGAPMMKLEFTGGLGFNAAVRSDGLFESGVATSPRRGPDSSFVSTRISGRVNRGGVLQGVARLSAVKPDGVVLCDLALTVRGERQP
jgi:hypothetical protein